MPLAWWLRFASAKEINAQFCTIMEAADHWSVNSKGNPNFMVYLKIGSFWMFLLATLPVFDRSLLAQEATTTWCRLLLVGWDCSLQVLQIGRCKVTGGHTSALLFCVVSDSHGFFLLLNIVFPPCSETWHFDIFDPSEPPQRSQGAQAAVQAHMVKEFLQRSSPKSWAALPGSPLD
jgi:hypothetical protein